MLGKAVNGDSKCRFNLTHLLLIFGAQGGSAARARTTEKIVQGGVAVMGHIGLTPQAISVIGGFRAQGRTAARARTLVDEALRLQDAGVFAIVLECVPENVAAAITETLEVPTIGIGYVRAFAVGSFYGMSQPPSSLTHFMQTTELVVEHLVKFWYSTTCLVC